MKLAIAITCVMHFCTVNSRTALSSFFRTTTASPSTERAELLSLSENDAFRFTPAFQKEDSSTTVVLHPVTPTSTVIPQDDYLKDLSIQDILSLGIDENEKIKKKIVNAMNEFSANYQNYKVIKLSAENYTLPEKAIKFDTSQGSVVFYDLSVSESYETTYNQKHETVVGCDLPGTVKVQVTLADDITITAKIIITESSASQIVKQGLITVKFKNGVLKKHLKSTDMNDAGNETFSELIYDSSVQVVTDSKSYRLVYRHVEAFLNELESLEVFLTAQLDKEIIKRNISFSNSCSKLENMRYDKKKVASLLFNNRMNYLYVIPNAKVETWNKVVLSAGPIVIEGLSNITSSETIVVDGDNVQPFDSSYNKSLIIRVKTGMLNGKFEWHYNFHKNNSNPALVFFFSINQVQFQSTIYRKPSDDYNRRTTGTYYYHDYTRMYRTSTPSSYEMERYNVGPVVKVDIGEIEIKTSKSNFCESEEIFVNIVLSEFLKSIIVDSLTNSITEEINARRSLFLQSFNDA